MLIYIRNSIWRGLLAGVIFSLAYIAVVIPLTGMLLILTNISGGKVFEALIGAGIITVLASSCSFVFGVVPGAILGVLGGLIFGLLMFPWRERLTPAAAALIATLLLLPAIAIFHIVAGPDMIASGRSSFLPYFPYLLWMVGPSIFAVPAAAWAGWSLQKSVSGDKRLV